MKKKIGPLPLVAWIGIAAAIFYVYYRYHKSQSTGVEEGFFPTQGIPAEGLEGGGAGTSGLEAIQQAFSEGAEQRQIGHEEAQSERIDRAEARGEGFQERAEERAQAFQEWLAGKGKGGKGAGKKNKPKGTHTKGGTKKKPANKNNPPKSENHGDKTPGHTQNPSHKAAAHPSTRSGGTNAPKPKAKNSGGGTGGNKKKAKAHK